MSFLNHLIYYAFLTRVLVSFPLPGPSIVLPVHLIVHVPQPDTAHFSCGLHRGTARKLLLGTLLSGLISMTPFD